MEGKLFTVSKQLSSPCHAIVQHACLPMLHHAPCAPPALSLLMHMCIAEPSRRARPTTHRQGTSPDSSKDGSGRETLHQLQSSALSNRSPAAAAKITARQTLCCMHVVHGHHMPPCPAPCCLSAHPHSRTSSTSSSGAALSQTARPYLPPSACQRTASAD
jgi:hypothetical protein